MRETSTYIVKQALTKRETSSDIYIRNASLYKETKRTKRQREQLILVKALCLLTISRNKDIFFLHRGAAEREPIFTKRHIFTKRELQRDLYW